MSSATGRPTPLNDLVLPLGYCSYADYLKSALWVSIRSRVYEAKGRVCLECKEAPATEIHHRRYDEDTLRGLTLNYLVPICDPCHERIHNINRAARLKQAQAKRTSNKQERKVERKKQRSKSKRDKGNWGPRPSTPIERPGCVKCKRVAKAGKIDRITGLCGGCAWTLKQDEIRKHNKALMASRKAAQAARGR